MKVSRSLLSLPNVPLSSSLTPSPLPSEPPAQDLCETSPTSPLRDNPGDTTTAEMVTNLLAVRAKAAAGETITFDDMIPYSQTTAGNHSEVYIDREYFTEAVLPALWNATKSIHMAMLSFDGGHFSNYVVDTLIDMKRKNPDLEVRIIADNLQSNALFPWSKGRVNLNRLKEVGIEVVFNRYFQEGMEHRKSIIIDSTEGFIGGSCINDSYFGNKDYWRAFEEATETKGLSAARDGAFLPAATRENSFKITPAMETPEYGDFGISLKGPVVGDLQASFLQSWLKQEQALRPDLTDAELKATYFPPLAPAGDLPIKLTHGIPYGHREMAQNLFSIIEGAEKTLDIEMAYIHVAEFNQALARAAKRGVKIRLLTNSQKGIDKEFSWHINRQYYPDLLAAGVRIFETHHYTHRKFMVADNRLVFTSTGNPEFHSWEKAWDEIALVDSPTYAAEVMSKAILPGLNPEHSKEVLPADLAKESLWTRIKSAFFTFFYNLFSRVFRFLVNHEVANEKQRSLITPAVLRAPRPARSPACGGNHLTGGSPLVLTKPLV